MSFNVCGFLYHPKSKQILLFKSNTDENTVTWSLFEGEAAEGEDAPKAFQRIVLKQLNINLKDQNIYPIYDYLQNRKLTYVFYGEVSQLKSKTKDPTWLALDKIPKLSLKPQAKQDVIVGERVINLKKRDDLAKLG